ncbi:response regulator [Planctomycetes bacterium K23_9]
MPTRIDRSMHRLSSPLCANVMLIDSQPVFLNILAAGFDKRGFKNIVTASAVGEAIAKMHGQQPDLVVVGLDAEDQLGVQALAAIRKDAALRLTPVLVITTAAQVSYAKVSFHLSEDAVFSKPIDMGRLIDVAVDRICDRNLRDSISATVRRSRAIPASDKYRRLRKIVGRSEPMS